ncbi:MAG: hypothetical protein OYK82_14920 [Gammaproteobacteria bacterium]|nr:hypothetical protein [Gammaproteobacteria bacterium]
MTIDGDFLQNVDIPANEIDPILAMRCRRERRPKAVSGFRRNDFDGVAASARDHGRAQAMDLRPDNACDRIGPMLGAQGNHGRRKRPLPHGEVANAVLQVRASNARACREAGLQVPRANREAIPLFADRWDERGGASAAFISRPD